MVRTLFLLIAFSTLIACRKTKSEPEFVKGDVLTGIKAGVSIDTVFAVFNRLGLQIKQVQNFTYAVPYPSDKLDSISAYLNTKPYVDSLRWKAGITYNHVRKQNVYYSTFFDMDKADQADWLLTVDQLHLTDLGDAATVYLRVPIGTEQYWVDQLSRNSIIRWAELNQIVHMQL